METREHQVYVATKLSDVCVHLASVVKTMVEQMLQYHKSHLIKIDYTEKRQWDMLIKCTKNLDAMTLDMDKESRATFRNNVKMFAVLMRLILSRVDDDDMKLYKWYNYIKAFPTDLPEIQPTGEEEIEAFKHLFG